jgi:Family of unknown function (DUF5681)
MQSEKTGQQHAGRFRKGEGGNPAGRPRGAGNSATLAAEALLDGEAEALTRKAIEMALEGDPVALRLCMDRILPAHKDRPVSFTLPPITSARDAADISAAVIDAVSNGAIGLGEAAEIAKLIDAYVRAYKTAELDDRVACAEQLTDAELLRIAGGGPNADQRATKLLLLNPR